MGALVCLWEPLPDVCLVSSLPAAPQGQNLPCPALWVPYTWTSLLQPLKAPLCLSHRLCRHPVPRQTHLGVLHRNRGLAWSSQSRPAGSPHHSPAESGGLSCALTMLPPPSAWVFPSAQQLVSSSQGTGGRSAVQLDSHSDQCRACGLRAPPHKSVPHRRAQSQVRATPTLSDWL